MFDNYYYPGTLIPRSPSVEYVPYTKTVIEQRAPTDESIKLLKEMRAEALNSIIRSIHIANNSINGTVYTLCLPAGGYQMACIFKINGQEYVFKSSTAPTVYKIEDMIEYFRTSIATEVSRAINSLLDKSISEHSYFGKDYK